MDARRISLRLIVPVCAVAGSLLFIELLLRLPVFGSLKDFEPALLGDSLTYRPHQVARHRLGADFDTEIHINSRGFRDHEFEATMPVRTAVALGDSFTEGWGVHLDDTWSKQLQRLLADDYKHIYNAGRSGTNPKNYEAVYRRFFEGDPSIDLVILGLCLSNDIIDATTPSVRVSPPLTLAMRMKFYAMKQSVLYNVIHRSLRYNPRMERLLAKFGFTNPPTMPLDFSSSDENSRRWPFTAEFLASLGADIERSGRKFLVVLIPPKELAVDSYFDAFVKHTGSGPQDVDRFGFHNYVLAHLRERRIQVLDLTPEFRNPTEGQATDYYFRGDGHWSAAGHRVAAIKIAEHLKQMPSPPNQPTELVAENAKTASAVVE